MILIWRKDKPRTDLTEFPQVSVLIAARNEENTISRCLESLLAQDFPKDKLEILVGDDESIDDTSGVAKKVLDNYENGKVIRVTYNNEQLNGKANVLVQLAKKAKGKHLLITDADMFLPQSWVRSMVNELQNGSRLVTGVTLVEKDYFQSIDWMFALGMVKVMDIIGRPVTTMGNNMAINREAYDTIGGFENLVFSVTEDLALFQAVRKLSLPVKQLFNQQVLGRTLPIAPFSKLLQQRKRWMTGAMQLPWPIVALLFFQGLYFPMIVLLALVNWPLAILYFLFKWFAQTIFLICLQQSLKEKFSLSQLLAYEFYSYVQSVGTIFFYLMPIAVSWKGRKY